MFIHFSNKMFNDRQRDAIPCNVNICEFACSTLRVCTLEKQVHLESKWKPAGRWAGVFACLLVVLVLVLAGPLHSHNQLSKADSACALCHAGERSLATPPALDAGKPFDLGFAEVVVASQAQSSSSPTMTIRSPRAPPLAFQTGRLG